MIKKLLTTGILITVCHIVRAQSFHNSAFFNYGKPFATVTGYYQSAENIEILEQPDGKLISCGYDYHSDCNCYHILMLRADACGRVDSTFGSNGTVHLTFDQRNSGYDFHLEADGKILVVGTQAESNDGGQQKPFIARFLANGQPDNSFNGNGTNKITDFPDYTGFGYVLPLADGKYLAQTGNIIMRFNNNGTRDISFGNNGIMKHALPSFVPWTYTSRSVQRSDGKIISVAAAVGFSSHPNGKNPLFLCTDIDGNIDPSYGTDGYMADGEIYTQSATPFFLILQSDDKIVAIQSNGDDINKLYLTRYNTDGSIDLTYGTNGRTFVNYPRFIDAKRFGDDNILLYASIGGIPQQLSVIDKNGNVSQPLTINGSTGFVFPDMDGVGIDAGQALYFKNDNELIISNFTHGIMGSYDTYNVPVITQSGNILNANYTQPGAAYQWWYAGAPVSNATGVEYNAQQTGEYIVEVTSPTGCGYSTSYTVTQVLPVRLISFTGTHNANTNELQWQVATDGSLRSFLVERSTDAVLFKALGSVAFNSEKLFYSFTDANTGSNNYYYRITMIDADGTHKYSAVVKLGNAADNKNLGVYPNPAKDMLYINGAVTGSHIQVIDMQGRVLLTQTINSNTLNINRLTPGRYTLRYTETSGKTKSLPFIKQ